MLSSMAFTLILSLFFLIAFRKTAKKINLVDKPTKSKRHSGDVPVIGGISIFFALLISSIVYFEHESADVIFWIAGFILVCVGGIDDKFDISYKVRLVVQVCISMLIIFAVDMNVETLGSILGPSPLELSNWMSFFVTTAAVVGAINAFNMVDGMDGMLGGLATVTFSSLAFMFFLAGNNDLAIKCLMFIAALVPYVLLNIGIPFGQRFKIFMGDAGSMLVGFSIVWLLIKGSQPDHTTAIRPVTALWFIALPLMDMAAIMIRRVRKGQSPFKPDREHLHHICQRVGLSPRMTLLFICSLASLLALVGVLGEIYKINETKMFIAFLALFGLYFWAISHIFRITARVRVWVGKTLRTEGAA